MPELIDLLFPWPVVSTLVSHLGVEDLLQLSRANSEVRAVLHGFPRPRQPTSQLGQKDGATAEVRKDIFVGWHQNTYWKHLKSLAQMECAEMDHRKGYHFGLCRYCSSPVCDACIVRVSHPYNTVPQSVRSLLLNDREIGIIRTANQCLAHSNTSSLHRMLDARQSAQRSQFHETTFGLNIIQLPTW